MIRIHKHVHKHIHIPMNDRQWSNIRITLCSDASNHKENKNDPIFESGQFFIYLRCLPHIRCGSIFWRCFVWIFSLLMSVRRQIHTFNDNGAKTLSRRQKKHSKAWKWQKLIFFYSSEFYDDFSSGHFFIVNTSQFWVGWKKPRKSTLHFYHVEIFPFRTKFYIYWLNHSQAAVRVEDMLFDSIRPIELYKAKILSAKKIYS